MPVENSRQNKHGWWGTLSIDPDTEPKGNLKVGDLCIFVKTNRLSHHVANGTFILKINSIISLAAAKARFSHLPPQIVTEIYTDLDLITSNYPNLALVEILEADDQNTSPLTKKLNEYTRKLFTKDSSLNAEDRIWLDNNAYIGKEHIEQGMSL